MDLIRLRSLSLGATLLLASIGCTDGSSHTPDKPAVQRDAIVLLEAGYEGSWPTGLDPATNMTARANLSQMNAIFGGLFQLTADADGGNPRVVGVLASGYEILDDGRTILIHLREGTRFSDGTAFDAEAVRFNVERNLASPCTCAPVQWPWAMENRVTAVNDHTVALHFTRPYAAVINAFPTSNVNWIASPTALTQLGEEQFRITPVGAGPFKVVSNELSSSLVLERNPSYWDPGRPYLDRLVFRSIGSQQAAIQSLLAGDAMAYEGMTSTPLIEQAEGSEPITVTQQPSTSPYVIQLNTSREPFNDKRAREAIYYATDIDAIREGLFGNRYPASQSFTAPGGMFHHAQIPGYRHYDPERARALVHEVGGIQVKLGTLQAFAAQQIVTALQSQWQEVGMEVTIESYELATLIQEFRSGGWQAMLQTSGSFDPEASGGVTFRFRSDQPYTGVHDPELDRLLLDAAATFDPMERDRLYFEAAKYISDNAYAPFLVALAPAQLTAGGLVAPGLTTRIPPILVNTAVQWQDARIASE
jgi:peptide/nickel transport system substrate-binding protein